jgi:DNA repair exonuclease SbcCD ATPase subunit
MKRIKVVTVTFALLVTGPALGWAQSLGDVAKREEEKKKKSGKPPATAKVYTDEDLKKAHDADSSAVNFLPENESLQASRSSPADNRSSGGGEGGGRGEKYWRKQAAERRDVFQEADKRVKALESRIAALRYDTSPTNTQDPNRLQNRDRELVQAEQELEEARRELAQARQSLDNLEDEARRAGALPGWVR